MASLDQIIDLAQRDPVLMAQLQERLQSDHRMRGLAGGSARAQQVASRIAEEVFRDYSSRSTPPEGIRSVERFAHDEISRTSPTIESDFQGERGEQREVERDPTRRFGQQAWNRVGTGATRASHTEDKVGFLDVWKGGHGWRESPEGLIIGGLTGDGLPEHWSDGTEFTFWGNLAREVQSFIVPSTFLSFGLGGKAAAKGVQIVGKQAAKKTMGRRLLKEFGGQLPNRVKGRLPDEILEKGAKHGLDQGMIIRLNKLAQGEVTEAVAEKATKIGLEGGSLMQLQKATLSGGRTALARNMMEEGPRGTAKHGVRQAARRKIADKGKKKAILDELTKKGSYGRRLAANAATSAGAFGAHGAVAEGARQFAAGEWEPTELAKAAGLSAATGAIAMGPLQAATKGLLANPFARYVAESLAFGTVGPALEGHTPTMEDYAFSFAFLGVLKAGNKAISMSPDGARAIAKGFKNLTEKEKKAVEVMEEDGTMDQTKKATKTLLQAENVTGDVEVTATKTTQLKDRASLQKTMKEHFGINDSLQRSAIGAVTQARARSWARQIGAKPADWYKQVEVGEGTITGGTAKGATQIMEDGKRVVLALQNPDVSTAVHELSHVYMRDLFDLAKVSDEAANDLAKLENWAGVAPGSTWEDWSGRDLEKVSRAFEQYAREGKVPLKKEGGDEKIPDLEKAFGGFHTWFREIYSSFKESSIDAGLKKPVKEVFDSWMGTKGEGTPALEAGKVLAKSRRRSLDRLKGMSLTEWESLIKGRGKNLGISDALEALKHVDVEGTRGWYREGAREAMEIAKKEMPELASPENEMMFKAILSVTSQGTKVRPNYENSVAIFKHLLETGELPIWEVERYKKGKPVMLEGLIADGMLAGGAKYQAVLGNAQKLQRLIKSQGGMKQAMEFLLTTHKGSEIADALGLKKMPSPFTKGGTFYGSQGLGPKIGAYFLQLNGIHSEPVYDLWWSRTWNRWMGTPTKMVKDKNGNLKEVLVETPRGKTERAAMKATMSEIAKSLEKKTGEKWEPDQVQALLWYYEKELYKKAGVRDTGESISYKEAAADRHRRRNGRSSATPEDLKDPAGHEGKGNAVGEKPGDSPKGTGEDASRVSHTSTRDGDTARARKAQPRNLTIARDEARGSDRRVDVLYHLSREDISETGLDRKHAGTGAMGKESVRYKRLPDGTLDPESVDLWFYLPGRKPEYVVTSRSPYQFKIKNDLDLISMNDPKLDPIYDGLKDGTYGRKYIPGTPEMSGAFREKVKELGYEGWYQPNTRVAMVWKDIPRENIIEGGHRRDVGKNFTDKDGNLPWPDPEKPTGETRRAQVARTLLQEAERPLKNAPNELVEQMAKEGNKAAKNEKDIRLGLDPTTRADREREEFNRRNMPMPHEVNLHRWRRDAALRKAHGHLTDVDETHALLVADAINRGLPVPKHVLKDYPELAHNFQTVGGTEKLRGKNAPSVDAAYEKTDLDAASAIAAGMSIFDSAMYALKERVRRYSAKSHEASIWAKKLEQLMPDEEDRKWFSAVIEKSGRYDVEGSTYMDALKRFRRASDGKVDEKRWKDFRETHRYYKETMERIRKELNEYVSTAKNKGDYIKFLAHYLPHFYAQKDVNKLIKSQQFHDWVSSSFNRRQRKFISFQEAFNQIGIRPLTMDASKLMRAYANLNWRVATNREFITQLREMTDENGNKLVVSKAEDAGPGWVAVDHPAVLLYQAKKRGKMIHIFKNKAIMHPDVAKVAMQVLETPDREGFVRTVEKFNSMAKKMELSFSFFHHAALTESSFAVLGMRGFMMEDRVWDADRKQWVKTGKFVRPHKLGMQLLEDPNFVKDLHMAGLEIGSTADVAVATMSRMLLEGEEKAKSVPGLKPVVERVRKFNEGWDKRLWDNYHAGLKAASYYHLVENAMDGMVGKSVADIHAAKQKIARFVNRAYGGLEWETLIWKTPEKFLGMKIPEKMANKIMAASPKVRQKLQFFMLAPDWTIANLMIAAKTFDPKVMKDPLQRKLQLTYWRNMFTVLAATAIGGQLGIYLAFGDPDEGDVPFPWMNEKSRRSSFDTTPLLRWLGKQPGLENVPMFKEAVAGQRQFSHLGKQALEVLHWAQDPHKVLVTKGSPAVRTAMQQITGSEGFGFDTPWVDMGVYKSLPHRAVGVVKEFVPFSFSGNQFALTAPMAKGATNWKTRMALEKAFDHYANPRFKEPYMRAKLDALVPQILDAARRNNLNADQLFKESVANSRSKYYGKFFEALEKQDRGDMDKWAKSIISLHATQKGFLRSMKDRLSRRGVEYTPEIEAGLKKTYTKAAKGVARTRKQKQILQEINSAGR
jgi:hypothetical protein